jgi:intein/homing endonuclease
VLAQNATTGELTYKPVIARTVRPPSPMRTIAVDGEEIEATLGHPFWVVGVGWRMAKELEDGAALHGVRGSSTVGRIEPRDDAEAYNLVVADFGTYFVGKTGLLVHDNTPRQTTSAKLPGLPAN